MLPWEGNYSVAMHIIYYNSLQLQYDVAAEIRDLRCEDSEYDVLARIYIVINWTILIPRIIYLIRCSLSLERERERSRGYGIQDATL